jgi:hypothetical protein
LDNNMRAVSGLNRFDKLPLDAVGEIIRCTLHCGVIPRVCKAWQAAADAYWNSEEMRRSLELQERVVPLNYLREHGVLTVEQSLEQMRDEVARQPLDGTRNYDIQMPLDLGCGITVRVLGGRSENLTPPRVWVVVHRRRVPRQDRLYTLRQQAERVVAYVDALRALGGLPELPAEAKQVLIESFEARTRIQSLRYIATFALPPACMIRESLIRRIRALPTIGNPRFEDPPGGTIPADELLSGLRDHLRFEDYTDLMGKLCYESAILEANKESQNGVEQLIGAVHQVREQLQDAADDAARAAAIEAADLAEENEPVETLGQRLAFQADLRRIIVNLKIIFAAIVIVTLAQFSEYLQRNFF